MVNEGYAYQEKSSFENVKEKMDLITLILKLISNFHPDSQLQILNNLLQDLSVFSILKKRFFIIC